MSSKLRPASKASGPAPPSTASAFPMGLREVVPNWTSVAGSSSRKDADTAMTVRIGATQSTLTPTPLPEGAGGFVYASSSQHSGKVALPSAANNRFIEWTAAGDALTLTEISLDHRLERARVRFTFADAPILSGGISVHESYGHAVVILVTTVSSVHKMVFPHPDRLKKQYGGGDSLPSIFADANAGVAKEYCHVLQTAGTAPMPHLAASYYSVNLDEAHFVLANTLGSIYLVKMGNLKDMVTVSSLKTGSYLGRLLGNFGGMISRGVSGDSSASSAVAEAAVGLAVHPVGIDTYVFGLCKDHKVRMWSAETSDCVMVEDVLAFTTRDLRGLQQGTQSHRLRKVVLDETGERFYLAVFLCFSRHSQFCVLRPLLVDGQFKLDHVATVYAPEFDLIDFQVRYRPTN